MKPLSTSELLDLHGRLVKQPSISGAEAGVVNLVADFLNSEGARVEVMERNVIAWWPENPEPTIVLNSHLDTVPATPAWTRDPYDLGAEDERIYGLGSNDAKASVAAMITAFLNSAANQSGALCGLTLVADEETGGRGSEIVLPHLHKMGWRPLGIVVGEPTGLDFACAQKGLLIVELCQKGTVCHSANATGLNATNAIFEMARNLERIQEMDLGNAHGTLGQTTLQATVMRAGEVRNSLPSEARCLLDIRTSPGLSVDELLARLNETVSCEVAVVSDRLRAMECPHDAIVLKAAKKVRPQARTFGSSTMSDWAYCGDIPTIKCGPGRSSRSHQPDEFVLKSEIMEGAEFYGQLINQFMKEIDHGSTLAQG